MTILVDIGSTTIKYVDKIHGLKSFIDRKKEDDIYSTIKVFLKRNKINPLTNKFSVSSSANGGIRVGLFSYTNTLSGLLGYEELTRAGCNIIFNERDLNQNINKSLIKSCDKIVIVAGTTISSELYIISWIEYLLVYLNKINYSEENIVICSSFTKGNKRIKYLPALLDHRLKLNNSKLSEYFSRIYLEDLSDKKNISSVKELLNCNIRPTPEVVHSGYEKIYLGQTSYYLGTHDSIWIDIGGATTDIYYPRISTEFQDGVNILENPTSRKVLVSIGFEHSAMSTIKIAKDTFWYIDFTQKYQSIFLTDTKHIILERNRSFLVSICLLLSVIECCKYGKLNFDYEINFNLIKKIVLTGGGPFSLSKKHRDFLSIYIKKRIGTSIEMIYDYEYSCWTIGHELY